MVFIPTNLNICYLKVGTPDHKSAVSFGQNIYLGINTVGKKTQGFGQQMADDSTTVFPIGIIFDDEMIDMPSIKSEPKPGPHA
ncbi:hypothetical protein [Neobacillus sp. SAB-20_R2A]|uniref:hypothetical protein n=1 Tax=Neobacillus sp. SAB-20_R2A TaxID=3120519 RepID=UPI003C6E5ACA